MRLEDLTDDQLDKLKKTNPHLDSFIKEANRKPRLYTFTKQDVRKKAIKVLAVIADLNQGERHRVLEHAMKVNEV